LQKNKKNIENQLKKTEKNEKPQIFSQDQFEIFTPPPSQELRRHDSASQHINYLEVKRYGTGLKDILEKILNDTIPGENFNVKFNPQDESNTYFNIFSNDKKLAHISFHHDISVNNHCGSTHIQYEEGNCK